MRYTIPYEVPADTPHAAIIKATDLLRQGVEVEAITRVAPSVPGWYYVDIAVAEDEFIDHPADATVASEYGR